MDANTTTSQPLPLMTHERIIDLQRRVLAGEAVSNEELQAALQAVAMRRATSSPTAAKAKASTAVKLNLNMGAALAAFKAKNSGSAS